MITAPTLAVFFVMIACAIYCQITLRMPNVVTVPLMISGLAWGARYDLGWHNDGSRGGILASGSCILLALVTLIPSYAKFGVPAGTVKMQMGFTAWAGAIYGFRQGLLITFISTSLFLLCVAIIMVFLRAASRRPQTFNPRAEYQVTLGFVLCFCAIGSVYLAGLLV